MIRPLRTAHRLAFYGMAVLLPAVLIAGLTARPSSHVSEVSASQRALSARLVRQSEGLWKKHPIRSEFYRDADKTSVLLVPKGSLNEPDVLVYWVVSPPTEQSLPDNAQLLGPFVPGHPVPVTAERDGYLILFSLPHNKILDVASVEKLP